MRSSRRDGSRWGVQGGSLISPIYFFHYYYQRMENSFDSGGNPFPYYYALLPFQQYSCPKICNVLHIVNNLEDSTLLQCSFPENAFLQPHPSCPPESTHSDADSAVQQQARTAKGGKGSKKHMEEYKPYQRQGKKKQNFLKDNRNVMPIKIRQMLSFLTRERKSQEIVEKYVQLKGVAHFSEKKFYAFLKMKKERIGNYVTLPVLKQFLGVEPEKADLHKLGEQELYLELVRVLLRHYLNHVSTLCSLTSNRIRPEQKLEHVKVQRELLLCLQAGRK